MAKGKALHPRLVAAWDAFASADKTLRGGVEAINDRRALERLAAIEQSEGKQGALSCRGADDPGQARAARGGRGQARRRRDHAGARPTTKSTVKAAEQFSGSGSDAKIGSMFISNAKSFLITAKQLMRRIRDKVPYSAGDKMMLSIGGGGWMVEGSPPRLLRDYNQLVDAYNRGARI